VTRVRESLCNCSDQMGGDGIASRDMYNTGARAG